ncbi:hypothetical protein DKX38_025431 [Salix brachista]|uniref:Uncharacterized protein n=1 Tax=Salix brachista TaxID=2182728 RepID=A0A5N5JPP6_9ROSI|nr:hypothetical protein DKX38_025431 [Salix brachista]
MIKFKQEYYASGNSYQLNELSSTFHQTRMLSIETRRTTSRQHLGILYNIHANQSNGDLRKGPARGILWRKVIKQEPNTTVEENLGIEIFIQRSRVFGLQLSNVSVFQENLFLKAQRAEDNFFQDGETKAGDKSSGFSVHRTGCQVFLEYHLFQA